MGGRPVRTDGRMADEVRGVAIERGYTCHAQGSVLIQVGNTRVLCTAMVEDRVPRYESHPHGSVQVILQEEVPFAVGQA